MPDHLVSKPAFAALLDALIGEQTVVGVTDRGECFAFDRLARADDLRLDYDVALLPPKVYLQPPREDLLRFKMGAAQSVEPILDERPLLIVGVHPYDMVAVNQMDKVFAADNPDPHYLRRRANTTIICSNIRKAGPRAFANQLGTTRVDTGFDLFLTDIGDSYVVTVGTEKGAALIARAEGVADADADALGKRDEVLDATDALYGENTLACPTEQLPDLLAPEAALDHPIWEEKSRTCFACGSCNLVCPTCYCFDVQDDVSLDLTEGVRYRAWDGCLLADFASVASGENFRETRVQRFQHRLYRKFRYLYDRFGDLFCVGCGRCVTACLPDIANPVAILNALHGEDQS